MADAAAEPDADAAFFYPSKPTTAPSVNLNIRPLKVKRSREVVDPRVPCILQPDTVLYSAKSGRNFWASKQNERVLPYSRLITADHTYVSYVYEDPYFSLILSLSRFVDEVEHEVIRKKKPLAIGASFRCGGMSRNGGK